MKYVPELTWILFLRILDEREAHEADEAEALGINFTPTIKKPYRWRDWAAPDCALRQDSKASVWEFVHEDLLPHLKGLKHQRGANARQKVISEVMSRVERSRIDSEKNFLDVLDKVHEISSATVDDTHVFTLSQIYEGLLLKMGESKCGIVLDEGVLFRTNEAGFVQTKRKLLEECCVGCILSLPGGVFTAAGAGVKTNLVLFTKGEQTERIWYYDLSDIKVGKKTPLTQPHFDELFKVLPQRADTARSWTVNFAARLQKALDEARPHREKAAELSARADDLESAFRQRRSAKTATEEALSAMEAACKAVEREARESLAKGALHQSSSELRAGRNRQCEATASPSPAPGAGGRASLGRGNWRRRPIAKPRFAAG